jgi:hypothetical protein
MHARAPSAGLRTIGDTIQLRQSGPGDPTEICDTEPVVPFTSEQLVALRTAAPGWFRVVLTLGAACGLAPPKTSRL